MLRRRVFLHDMRRHSIILIIFITRYRNERFHSVFTAFSYFFPPPQAPAECLTVSLTAPRDRVQLWGEGLLNDNNTIRVFSGPFRLNPPAGRVSVTPSTDSRADRDKCDCEIIFQISGDFRNSRTSHSSVRLRFSDTVCACSTVVRRVISRAENARAAATAASLRWTREVSLRKNRRATTNGRAGRGAG